MVKDFKPTHGKCMGRITVVRDSAGKCIRDVCENCGQVYPVKQRDKLGLKS